MCLERNTIGWEIRGTNVKKNLKIKVVGDMRTNAYNAHA